MKKSKKFIKCLTSLALFGVIYTNQNCIAMPTSSSLEDQSKIISFCRKAEHVKFGIYELRAIRDDEESVRSLTKTLQEPVSLFFEDGKPWTEEKARERVQTVASYVVDWEKGEDLSLPWTLIYRGLDPVGLFLGRYHKGGKHAGYLEIACALSEEMWGKGLALQTAKAYVTKYILPILENCSGLFASINVNNEKACTALKKHFKAGEEYIVKRRDISKSSVWRDYMLTKTEIETFFESNIKK